MSIKRSLRSHRKKMKEYKLSFILYTIYGITKYYSFIIFSIIYTVSGGIDRFGNNYIYFVLDWNDHSEEATAYAALSLIGSVVFHLMVCFVFRIRRKIFYAVFGKGEGKVQPVRLFHVQ